MAINLSKVSITLQQFQAISDGMYNAGEVKLTSENTLGKINHHIHATIANRTSLSHAEILVIKNAFINALSQNGVGADKIAEIRRDLGLAPSGAADTELASRSIKPLSRQKIREILDDNKDTLNNHTGVRTIITHEEKYAEYTKEEREGFAQTRNQVNEAMVRQRRVVADRFISAVQAILAGDVRFSTPAERELLITAAELQKATILQRSHNNPSDDPAATMVFHRDTDGFKVTFALGMSEKDYVRRLDDMLVYLKTHVNPVANQAGLPKLSDGEANANLFRALVRINTGIPTRDMDVIQAGVRRELEARFGANLFKASTRFSSIAEFGDVKAAFEKLFNLGARKLSAEDFKSEIVALLGSRRLTTEEVKNAIVAQVASKIAKERFLSNEIGPRLVAAGGQAYRAATLASSLCKHHPEMLERLAAVQSPEEARAVLAEFSAKIYAGIRLQVACDRFREEARGWFRGRIADAMGVPVSVLKMPDAVSIRRLDDKTEQLMAEIIAGKKQADTEEQIKELFLDVAKSLAAERISLLKQVDALDIPAEARDILKNQILTLQKVTGLNFAELKAEADRIPVDVLIDALSDSAKTNKVLFVMGELGHLVHKATAAVYGRQNGGQPIGPDEIDTGTNLILTLALARRPNAFDLLRDFFERPEAAKADLANLGEGKVDFRPVAFKFFKPDKPAAATNAEIADKIGRPGAASVHVQAIHLALKDLGLGDLSDAEKAKLISGSDGRALARTVRNIKEGVVTPTVLRAMARVHFANAAAMHAADRYIARYAKDHGIADDPDTRGFVSGILFKHHPEILKKFSAIAARGDDILPVAARRLIDEHIDTVRAAIFSLQAIRNVNKVAVDVAVQQIALRASLDPDYVREKLDASGFLMSGGSLDFLRDEIRGKLWNPDTDISKWSVADVRKIAEDRLESFIAKKVAFISELDKLPNTVSDAARGALVADTLTYPPYKDPELPAAVLRMLDRDDVKTVLEYAKDMLTPEKVDKFSDDDLFSVFEKLGSIFNAAIEEVLPEEKRLKMDNDDLSVIRSLLTSLFVDYCGSTLVKAAEHLAAKGRLDSLETTGVAVRGRHDGDYMTWMSGKGLQGDVEVDEGKAMEAKRKSDAAAFGLRLLGGLAPALMDEWLPAKLVEAFLRTKTTTAQNRRIFAGIRHIPGAFKAASAGMTLEHAARLKAFAATIDWREKSSAESALRAAVQILRIARTPAQADAALALLDSDRLRAELAERGLAADEPLNAVYAAKINPATGDIEIGISDAGGRRVRFSVAARVAPDGRTVHAPTSFEIWPPMTHQYATALVAAAARAQNIQLDEARKLMAVALVTEFGIGMFGNSQRLLAHFVVSLALTAESNELDRRRLQTIAPAIAKWRDFGFDALGKEAVETFFKTEANALIRHYENPANHMKNGKYPVFSQDNVFQDFTKDLNRGWYTIAGKRFNFGSNPADIQAELNKLHLKPAARRAITELMSQASASTLMALQLQNPLPPNDLRENEVNPSSLPGAGAFVSRRPAPGDGFMSPQVVEAPSSIYDLSVSEDGTTATLKIVKCGRLVVGTDETKMETYFGSCVVEEELTIDLTKDVPEVTNVRLAQTVDESVDLLDRYLEKTAPRNLQA